MNTESAKNRTRALIVALLVALVGLTIAPGFTCTHEESPDGTKKTTVEM